MTRVIFPVPFLPVTYLLDIDITDEFRQPYGIKSMFGSRLLES
jgi:hypothetical protein